jgi:hypothetical protein
MGPAEPLQKLNKRLADNYGYLDGAVHKYPKFRVVFSDEQFEMRTGEFSDFSASGIYLRTVFETRRVNKYPAYPHKYILEVALPNETTEIKAEKVTYEMLWVFHDLEGKSRPDLVCWRVVNIFAHTYYAKKEKRTTADYEAEEQERHNADIEWFFEQLQNESPLIAGKLHDRSAIVNPGI